MIITGYLSHQILSLNYCSCSKEGFLERAKYSKPEQSSEQDGSRLDTGKCLGQQSPEEIRSLDKWKEMSVFLLNYVQLPLALEAAKRETRSNSGASYNSFYRLTNKRQLRLYNNLPLTSVALS